MPQLTSQEALQLTSTFLFTAERLRAADTAHEARAQLCEVASRVAFMRAHALAKQEDIRPVFGEITRRALYGIA